MKGLSQRFILAALVLQLILANAITPLQAEPVVKEWEVPFLAFLTGPYASLGEQIKWAADEAAREINEAGGIGGRPLVIRYHDTALDPAKAVAEMSKVVKDSLLIFGPIAAATTKAAMPLAVQEKVLAMAIACGADLSLEFQPWTVHFIPPYDELIPRPMAGWVERNPAMKTVVQFIWPLDLAWIDIANTQRRALEAVGIEVLPDLELSEGVNMSAAVVETISQKPDGCTIIVGPVEAGKIVKELEKQGLADKGRIIIFAAADDPALYEVGGAALEGVYHWNIFNMLSESPRWQALLARYQEAYPGLASPTIGVPLFYDMVYLAKMAIEATGVSGDPAKLAEERLMLRDYIRNIKDFPGVQFDFSIASGIARTPSFLFRIEGGQKRLLATYPPE